jgi:NosR/NirI family transcriptional regulator, nitrous oxide reductase regulator
MRTPVAIGTLILGATIAAGGQALDQRLTGQLKRLFPDASAFSPKEGSPPHFKAFVADPQTGTRTVVGYAFWTTELEPLERGYDGPIKILVGVNPKGLLAGVVVVDHHEPYGYFSVDLPEFAAQFKDKDIRDAFKVGDDVDAVSRATMTVTSATRAIRNGSRRLATKLLTPPDAAR